eukprot:TRINITY_DN5819_c0_g4_i1.p2 TRINITY_DN5819_c0_g4~~TRINITY_DN5819_c0_g4_i1.p2  ORF type:complete len:134 (+),score=29.75 TRINITY_DN5819_c0_g4_i1:3-404(+)
MVACMCIERHARDRPTMAEVASRLAAIQHRVLDGSGGSMSNDGSGHSMGESSLQHSLMDANGLSSSSMSSSGSMGNGNPGSTTISSSSGGLLRFGTKKSHTTVIQSNQGSSSKGMPMSIPRKGRRYVVTVEKA